MKGDGDRDSIHSSGSKRCSSERSPSLASAAYAPPSLPSLSSTPTATTRRPRGWLRAFLCTRLRVISLLYCRSVLILFLFLFLFLFRFLFLFFSSSSCSWPQLCTCYCTTRRDCCCCFSALLPSRDGDALYARIVVARQSASAGAAAGSRVLLCKLRCVTFGGEVSALMRCGCGALTVGAAASGS